MVWLVPNVEDELVDVEVDTLTAWLVSDVEDDLVVWEVGLACVVEVEVVSMIIKDVIAWIVDRNWVGVTIIVSGSRVIPVYVLSGNAAVVAVPPEETFDIKVGDMEGMAYASLRSHTQNNFLILLYEQLQLPPFIHAYPQKKTEVDTENGTRQIYNESNMIAHSDHKFGRLFLQQTMWI